MRFFKVLLIVLGSIFLSCNSIKSKTTDELKNNSLEVDKLLYLNALKLNEVAKKIENPEKSPRSIDYGNKEWEYKDINNWCSGFWPGALWYAYEFTQEDEIKKQAERFTAPLKPIAYNKARNHDIGFMIYCSYGNAYRLTGNKEYKDILLAAADTLATLYNPKAGTILSWPRQLKRYQHNTIIDNMMNLELLFWASKNGGNNKLYEIAKQHAKITMKHIVRHDHSIYHVGSFDQNTGEFLRGYTHQGYADESMWARGQTWGIYGFSVAYRETLDKEFLNTAIDLANHYINRLPEDKIPYWDFDAPHIPNEPKDASAAAIAACGMLELATLVNDSQLKSKYLNAAKDYIQILSTEKYLSGDKNDALLMHSTGNYNKNSEVDASIIYADYYYMEALIRLKNYIKVNQ